MYISSDPGVVIKVPVLEIYALSTMPTLIIPWLIELEESKTRLHNERLSS
ncbi:hypothetical protein LSTR_LSTR009754 [Laodelphax striatellus]|uniref:Uncharacterized protein n=1 Tax=Laodelphax striatellus TaxID=195883 RepID=A0A482WI32_LAOST|nr:hypothetical protein LSTR_LSTR009754 [Laodelphax striatellus]